MRQFHLTVLHANYCERGNLSYLKVNPKGIIVLLMLVLLPGLAVAQLSFTYSPTSVIGWGGTPDVEMMSFSYQFDVKSQQMEVGILRVNSNNMDIRDTVLDLNTGPYVELSPIGAPIEANATGLYFLPFIYHNNISFVKLSLSAGAIYFDKAYPTENAEQFNLMFRFQASTKIYKSIGIALSYTHISNAYTGKINPGMDFPSISLTYNL